MYTYFPSDKRLKAIAVPMTSCNKKLINYTINIKMEVTDKYSQCTCNYCKKKKVHHVYTGMTTLNTVIHFSSASGIIAQQRSTYMYSTYIHTLFVPKRLFGIKIELLKSKLIKNYMYNSIN